MELFYDEMIKYNECENDKKEYNKIYYYNKLKNKNFDNLYGLFINYKLELASQSIISLLIEQTNLQFENEGITYSITKII